MKTLYISDLDGTLLDGNAEITPYTRDVINAFTSSGGFFTVATARTEATVKYILQGLELNVPAVLMNGVTCYDMKTGKYIMPRYMPEEGVRAIIDVVEKRRCTGFIYSLKNNTLTITYKWLETPQAKAFVEERRIKYGKVFTQVENFDTEGVLTFCTMGKKELLDPVAETLKNTPGLNVSYHNDVYDTDVWYLDVCAEGVSKYTSVAHLKETYGFDRVAVFGDNHNDVALFEGADERYAVENAVPSLKAMATEVIGKNTENGVAKWIEKTLTGEKR